MFFPLRIFIEPPAKYFSAPCSRQGIAMSGNYLKVSLTPSYAAPQRTNLQ